MVKKLALDDEFYLSEASVYGIVSEIPDYRLCYFINQAMQLQLVRTQKDRELRIKKGVFAFSEYECEDPHRQLTWLLTSNRKARALSSALPPQNESGPFAQYENSSIPLVADLKMIDYFFWYNTPPVAALDSLINTSLKQIPHVRSLQKINIENSKHIHNLLIEY